MAAEPVFSDAASDAWRLGCRAHPAIRLDQVTFARHLAHLATRRAHSATSLCHLAIEDLFLACALAAQTPRAAEAFRSSYGEMVRASIARAVPEADVAEVEQRLISKLLVGTPESRPKIETYAGEGRLDRWLQIAAKREALMWLRANRAAPRRVTSDPLPAADPEIEHLKEQYREDFERALTEALERLDDGDRTLLRLHFVHGLSLEKVGRMFGFSQTTASRRLSEARAALLADVKSTLKTRLRASTNEIASLARLVASHLDLNLSHLLRD